MVKLWGYNPSDNFHNRRNLAFTSAIYSLIIWPNLLLALHIFGLIDVDLIKAMLAYVATLAGTSIGAYFWAAFKTPIKAPEGEVGDV